jgi:ribosomal protein S18 acetylase RimI-like enzyme
MSGLSSRFSARPASLDDAGGILEVALARDLEDLGYPDYSLDDVNEELAKAAESWVVTGEDGAVVAYAFLSGGHAPVLVHQRACGAGIGTWLREQVEQRARERGETVIRQHVSGSNDTARRLLGAAGYRPEQHFWRMERELDGDLPEPAWPAGAEPRPYALGADDAAAHALVQDAFRDVPGHVDRGLDEWRAMAVGSAQFAADLSTVAGSFAGVALCQRWEDRGYIAYLATARDWRGRGLGRALLASSLAKIHAAGFEHAVLVVNDRNESATRLYESVGMKIASRSERWDKRLA